MSCVIGTGTLVQIKETHKTLKEHLRESLGEPPYNVAGVGAGELSPKGEKISLILSSPRGKIYVSPTVVEEFVA